MMSDIPAKQVFHTLDQLTRELFPKELRMDETGLIHEAPSEEADVLAKKLIDELLNKQRSEQK